MNQNLRNLLADKRFEWLNFIITDYVDSQTFKVVKKVLEEHSEEELLEIATAKNVVGSGFILEVAVVLVTLLMLAIESKREQEIELILQLNNPEAAVLSRAFYYLSCVYQLDKTLSNKELDNIKIASEIISRIGACL